jgi:hypothetical protein
MFKKLIYIISILFMISGCGNTFDSVKRGMTGAKSKSTDEFLVQKKNPLILPPDYENLPTPGDREIASEEISLFENTLETSVEENTSKTSVENSILKKIQSK